MESVDMEKFGAFVARLRKERGLTQKELGARLAVSDKAVSKWERGLSLPGVELLLPLAEALGVTVTELLKGERVQAETMPVREVEQLVGRTLELTAGERVKRRRERRRWVGAYAACAAASVLELFGLAALGCDLEHMSGSVFVAVVLLLIFGGWFCLGAPETLPAYYDEYPVDCVSDGIFRIHMSGMRFNNRNWPHIVRASRIYALAAAVGFPPVYLLLEWAGLNQKLLPPLLSTLSVSLGIMIPIYVVGRKYQG